MGPFLKLVDSRFCVCGGAERLLKVVHERGEERVSVRGWYTLLFFFCIDIYI
jgi:hypothetical protein